MYTIVSRQMVHSTELCDYYFIECISFVQCWGKSLGFRRASKVINSMHEFPYVCPSILRIRPLGFPCNDWREIIYWKVLLTCVEKIKIWSKSEKDYKHFTRLLPWQIRLLTLPWFTLLTRPTACLWLTWLQMLPFRGFASDCNTKYDTVEYLWGESMYKIRGPSDYLIAQNTKDKCQGHLLFCIWLW